MESKLNKQSIEFSFYVTDIIALNEIIIYFYVSIFQLSNSEHSWRIM